MYYIFFCSLKGKGSEREGEKQCLPISLGEKHSWELPGVEKVFAQFVLARVLSCCGIPRISKVRRLRSASTAVISSKKGYLCKDVLKT